MRCEDKGKRVPSSKNHDTKSLFLWTPAQGLPGKEYFSCIITVRLQPSSVHLAFVSPCYKEFPPCLRSKREAELMFQNVCSAISFPDISTVLLGGDGCPLSFSTAFSGFMWRWCSKMIPHFCCLLPAPLLLLLFTVPTFSQFPETTKVSPCQYINGC